MTSPASYPDSQESSPEPSQVSDSISSPSTTSLLSNTFSLSPSSDGSFSPPTTPSVATGSEVSLDRKTLKPFISQQSDMSGPIHPQASGNTDSHALAPSADSDDLFYTPPASPMTSPPGSRAVSPEQHFLDANAEWSDTIRGSHNLSQNDLMNAFTSKDTGKWDEQTSATSSAAETIPDGALGAVSTVPDRRDTAYGFSTGPPRSVTDVPEDAQTLRKDRMVLGSQPTQVITGTAGLHDSAFESENGTTQNLDTITANSTPTAHSIDSAMNVFERRHTAGKELIDPDLMNVDSATLIPAATEANRRTAQGAESTTSRQDGMVLAAEDSGLQGSALREVLDGALESNPNHASADHGDTPTTQPTLDLDARSPLSALMDRASRMREQVGPDTSMREGTPDTAGLDMMVSSDAESMPPTDTMTAVTEAAGDGDRMDDITHQLTPGGAQSSPAHWGWYRGTTRVARSWLPERVPKWTEKAASRLPSMPDWGLRQRAAGWKSLVPSNLDTGLTEAKDRIQSRLFEWERPDPKAYLGGLTDRLHSATSAFEGLKSRVKSKWPTGYKRSEYETPACAERSMMDTNTSFEPSTNAIHVPQNTSHPAPTAISAAISAADPTDTADTTKKRLFSRLTSGLGGFGRRPPTLTGGGDDKLSQEESTTPNLTLQERQDHVSGALTDVLNSDSGLMSKVTRYFDELSKPADPIGDLTDAWKAISTATGGLWR